jgi:phosphoribosyl-ATP pyrophosphohydrolase
VNTPQAATQPVVLQGADGTVVDVAATTEKGAKKSIEQGVLWVVDPETGRLLPYAGEAAASEGSMPVASVTEHSGWYLATVAAGSSGGRAGDHTPPAATGPETGAGPNTAAGTATAAGPQTAAGQDAAGRPDFTVLAGLWQTIRERNRSRPEGSYTTHLFTEGEEKIRKKTGEEAVELLLSRSVGETTHEAADLIYHLFVLLESSGIGVEPVLAELAERGGGR